MMEGINEPLEEKLGDVFGENLADPSVNELVIQREGEFGVERSGCWQWHECGLLTRDYVDAMVGMIGSPDGRKARAHDPVLSGRAGGGRALVIMPPVVQFPSLTIRRATAAERSLESLVAPELFVRLVAAVTSRKTIVVAGPIGSGKTTLAAALARHIGSNERIVTIESPREIFPRQRNAVQMEYDADAGDEAGGVDASRLLRAAKRARPDRVLLGECRGKEAFEMLDIALSGHPGGITTMHADSRAATLLQLRSYAMQHDTGRAIGREGIDEMIALAVDLVVVVKARRVVEVWTNPRIADAAL